MVRQSVILATIFIFCSFLFSTTVNAKHLPILSGIYGLLSKTLNFGSIWSAVIGIAFTIAWYVVTKEFSLVHRYVAILNGFKLNIGCITGLVALKLKR